LDFEFKIEDKNMKRKKKLLYCYIVILLILLIGLSSYFFIKHYLKPKINQPQVNLNKQALNISQVTIENVEFNVELAKTPQEREKGLSGREELCLTCGMLFVFPRSDYHRFWMKETLIPLDIIWIDENWQVVDFVAFAQPQGKRKLEELPVYSPKKPARYVLELPGGTVEKIRNFKRGSVVSFEE